MSKARMTINANTLFPIDELKNRLKEALMIADQLGPAIITKGNRPVYAVIRLDSEDKLSAMFSEQFSRTCANAKGLITTDPDPRTNA